MRAPLNSRKLWLPILDPKKSEKVVKAVKKPRKTPGGKGQGKGGNGENVEKMITLSERQTKDRDTTEQKITEACVELEGTIALANAP